jgi:hypothetical protein
LIELGIAFGKMNWKDIAYTPGWRKPPGTWKTGYL